MKVHESWEESAIVEDMLLYGHALVREPIPEWWGALGRIIDADLRKEMKQ